ETTVGPREWATRRARQQHPARCAFSGRLIQLGELSRARALQTSKKRECAWHVKPVYACVTAAWCTRARVRAFGRAWRGLLGCDLARCPRPRRTGELARSPRIQRVHAARQTSQPRALHACSNVAVHACRARLPERARASLAGRV